MGNSPAMRAPRFTDFFTGFWPIFSDIFFGQKSFDQCDTLCKARQVRLSRQAFAIFTDLYFFIAPICTYLIKFIATTEVSQSVPKPFLGTWTGHFVNGLCLRDIVCSLSVWTSRKTTVIGEKWLALYYLRKVRAHGGSCRWRHIITSMIWIGIFCWCFALVTRNGLFRAIFMLFGFLQRLIQIRELRIISLFGPKCRNWQISEL